MNTIFLLANVVKNKLTNSKITNSLTSFMACFCGCETYEKNPDGRIIGCMKCNHGPQNHDEKFRESARRNEEQSQKRDADFG